MSALECRGLVVERGGTRVVHGLDLQVEAGGWVAVVGPNGAGKSSLLLAVAGLVPCSGHLRVAGEDPGRLSRRAASRVVALMPQQPVVPPGMSVRELVALGRTPHLRTFATESADDLAAVGDALTRLDLVGLSERPVETLSGGELQRAMLARALCQEPQLLLLDEPTSALDVGHQQAVLDLVDSLRVERGITVVAAMHDLTLAAQYAERVVLLDGGRKAADGTPTEVFEANRIDDVYGARVDVLDRPSGPAVVPVRRRTP